MKKVSVIVSFIIHLKIIYYWILLILFGSEVPDPIIYTIPSLIFSLLLFLLIARNRKFKKSSYLILLFILFSVYTGVYNKDFFILLSTFTFAVPFLVVNEVNFNLSKNYLYILFYLTIGIGILSFHIGMNQYGYLPGHSLLKGNLPWWRINLFPNSSPTYTGFFGVIYFIIGSHFFLKNKKATNLSIVLLSIYLTALSGSRTAVLILLGAFFIFFFRENKKFIQHCLPYAIFSIPLIIFSTSLIFYFSGDELAREYLLRGQVFDDDQQVASYSRFILWSNLIDIYLRSPILGVGRFSLLEYYPLAIAHSEAKWFHLLASNGIFVFLFIAYVFMKFHTSISRNKITASSLWLMFVIAMAYYGSMYVPYNFIFFLNIYMLSKIEPLKKINK